MSYSGAILLCSDSLEPPTSIMEGEQRRKHQQHNGPFNVDGDDDIIRWFDMVAENAAAAQTQTLRRILEQNSGAEYLKRLLGDVKIEDVDDSELESLYTKMVPLSTHADFEPFIQRIADGDTTPLLTQQPITALSVTSGTSGLGRAKYIPFMRYYAKVWLQGHRLAAAFRSRVYPTKESVKALEFIYCTKKLKSKGGLTIAPITTHFFSSQEFIMKQEKIKSFTCSPWEVISGEDYRELMYCHLLLGLFFSEEVELVGANFAYTLVQALTSFQDLWLDLCCDIKEGTLNTARVNCPNLRKAVLDIISPNPSLGSKTQDICRDLESSNWVGLIPNLWPNAKYVCTVLTGSMQPYAKKLEHYARDLPLITLNYTSSESPIGINADPCSLPQTAAYTVVPTVSYYEFIPLYKIIDCDISWANIDYIEDEPIPLSQVKVGQHYDIVLTTFTGLCRYKLGDIVEVTGFYKGTPKLKYIRRRNQILSMAVEKTTEEDLQIAVERGSAVMINKAATTDNNVELVDFTSHADMSTQPGYYIIYWEIKGDVANEVEDSVFQECCTEMDVSFVNLAYSTSRKINSIGPLKLCIVEKGTFKKLVDHFVKNGGSVSQFKTPKCTNDKVVLTILNDCTIKRFQSTAYEYH